jgi:uncharacterized membrane protein
MDALMPGLRGMLNYHPLFVHFPVALWLAALGFEALAQLRGNDEWHRTAVHLLYVGTLAGVLAAWTGLRAEMTVPGESSVVGVVLEEHKLMMLTTTSFAIGLCVAARFLRREATPTRRRLFLVGLLLLGVMLTIGADRGAELVFKYGVAVRRW